MRRDRIEITAPRIFPECEPQNCLRAAGSRRRQIPESVAPGRRGATYRLQPPFGAGWGSASDISSHCLVSVTPYITVFYARCLCCLSGCSPAEARLPHAMGASRQGVIPSADTVRKCNRGSPSAFGHPTGPANRDFLLWPRGIEIRESRLRSCAGRRGNTADTQSSQLDVSTCTGRI